MRLKELIHEPSLLHRLEMALISMDWEYDLDANDTVRLDRGAVAYEELRTMMGALYTQKPDAARVMWEAYCPYAISGSLPAILKR